MKCPIKGVSKDCEKCDGDTIGWLDINMRRHECVFVTVWKRRKKAGESRPYKPLSMKGISTEKEVKT